MKITKSADYKSEYCCTVVKIGSILPIKGKDKIGQTLVNGQTIVVNKDEIHEGQIYIYVSNECQLNADFLRINNMYSCPDKNADHTKRGYIPNTGRIKMIKLGGVTSMGLLFTIKELQTYMPNIKSKDLPAVGEDFDTIDGKLFVQAYVPPRPPEQKRQSRDAKRNKRLLRYSKMIPGEFKFHYDTNQLAREMDQFSPDDKISISVKLHGTSIIIGNVRTRSFWTPLCHSIGKVIPFFNRFANNHYEVIYSSRNVIKNEFASPLTKGFYEKDIWSEYYELLRDYIPQGVTIYGEIIGYVTGTNTYIQKGYDYDCEPGTNRLMIYRVVINDENGDKIELSVPEVRAWTYRLIEKHPELVFNIHPINILYNGRFGNLFEDLPEDEHWRENVLERLKHCWFFGMERNENYCRNEVPREGIVIRKNDDQVAEAWKLKCLKFLGRESELIDEGIIDVEMQNTYEPI